MADATSIKKIIIVDDRQFLGEDKQWLEMLRYCLKNTFENLEKIEKVPMDSRVNKGEQIEPGCSLREDATKDKYQSAMDELTKLIGKESKSTLILLDLVFSLSDKEQKVSDDKQKAIEESGKIFEELTENGVKVIRYSAGLKDETVKSILVGKNIQYDNILEIDWNDPIHFSGAVERMYYHLFTKETSTS